MKKRNHAKTRGEAGILHRCYVLHIAKDAGLQQQAERQQQCSERKHTHRRSPKREHEQTHRHSQDQIIEVIKPLNARTKYGKRHLGVIDESEVVGGGPAHAVLNLLERWWRRRELAAPGQLESAVHDDRILQYLGFLLKACFLQQGPIAL